MGLYFMGKIDKLKAKGSVFHFVDSIIRPQPTKVLHIIRINDQKWNGDPKAAR